METYEFLGTKVVSFNSNTTTAIIDSQTNHVAPILNRSSYAFSISSVEIYARITGFLESPLSFAKKTDTILEKWFKDRELIKNYANIAIDFSINNVDFLTTFIVGSSHPYNFTIEKEIRLGVNENLSIKLRNTGNGLLLNQDVINIALPYKIVIMGSNTP